MTEPYRNFRTAVYCTARDVLRMQDEAWRDGTLAAIEGSVHIDKVYLESFRSMETVDRAVLERTRDFFAGKGIATAGCITTSRETTPEWDFKSLCYSSDEDRRMLAEVSALTAELFDEIILDDFFFTNCTCERCVAGKGDRTWAEFRLDQMREVSENLVVGPAKKANPKVTVIVKYPNWYENFANAGYNLDLGSTVFDGAYTGTETRDATYSSQHLPPFLSFGIVRYYENIHPGRNGGGWVDPFQRRDLDRYGEQLRLTLLAKAREITLFCWGVLADWYTEFDNSPDHHHVAPTAGRELRVVDDLLGHLGTPTGLASYRPVHTSGEAFLHHHLGTAGIPTDMTPVFPDAGTVLLTEGAKADPDIVAKTQAHLQAGHTVVLTSGLLRVIEDEFQRVVPLQVTDRKAMVDTFTTFSDVYRSAERILLPEVAHPTNGASEVISALHGEASFPVLIRVLFGPGVLYVLTIPDTPTDLYELPREIGTALKRVLLRDQLAHVEGAAKIGLFLYDNDTLVINSFTPHPTEAVLVVHRVDAVVTDLVTGEAVPGTTAEVGTTAGGTTRVPLALYPGTFRAFRVG